MFGVKLTIQFALLSFLSIVCWPVDWYLGFRTGASHCTGFSVHVVYNAPGRVLCQDPSPLAEVGTVYIFDSLFV